MEKGFEMLRGTRVLLKAPELKNTGIELTDTGSTPGCCRGKQKDEWYSIGCVDLSALDASANDNLSVTKSVLENVDISCDNCTITQEYEYSLKVSK